MLLDSAYQKLLKPILFKFDPELIHDGFTLIGKTLGSQPFTRNLTAKMFVYKQKSLVQQVAGLTFKNPVGLSAGFDYDGKMSGIMSSVGFGFESIGTITRSPYAGNTKPRLARLPKSQSLLVNKGFKSAGIEHVMDHYLQKPDADFQIGLSIGATNSPQTSEPKTQIPDILSCFEIAQQHPKFKLVDYLELNISCPNVMGAGTLASKKHLKPLLTQLNQLSLNKPIFVKFPIHIEDKEALELVEIMVNHQVAAVTIGNLYKQRNPEHFDPHELKTVENLKGNFSGKPTQNLSNHLISLVYKHFSKDIAIIGVGGIFSAQDAYEKIRRGASLVQLITGMIYKGPQLIGQINRELTQLLKIDGFETINQAIGANQNKSHLSSLTPKM